VGDWYIIGVSFVGRNIFSFSGFFKSGLNCYVLVFNSFFLYFSLSSFSFILVVVLSCVLYVYGLCVVLLCCLWSFVRYLGEIPGHGGRYEMDGKGG